MRYFLLTMWALFTLSDANYPVFEGAGQLKELLVPADVHIGSVIYRLRASDSDHDYPLQFDATDYGSYVVKVENLPCNVNSTYCEANVYLERVLMVGQVFKFRFTVRDTKGDTTTASVSIEVTDAPVDITAIFPHLPGIIILPENTKPGTELEYVIVRRNPEYKKPALLEIRGSSVVDFGRIRSSQETTTGVITLKKGLDFEQQNMYKLQIFALDMYTDKMVDSRNIAGFEIILIVEDVQDTPPIFINTEPTVKLPSNLSQGDTITKVLAIDGDRGNPRPINYGLVSENNPFTIFFNIDRTSGLITLSKPLKQLTSIARSHQPILLTILAEEERSNIKEPPALSTTATIALLLAEAGNTPPYFDNDHYVCHLNENSPQGAALVFSDAYSTQVHDDDMGKHGVFSLVLEKNNGTFEISPNVVERKASFTIRVRNNLLLDYESRKSVEFVIVARELDPGSLSSSVTVLVYLNDVNDNPPQFQHKVYMSQIPENTTANAYVTEVKAFDVDTEAAGRVHYTRILGFRNSSLLLNSVTGVITVASDNHGFDREEASEYHLTVEARDMEGTGLLATVPLVIRILDVNDETPMFENAPFHFTLTPDLRNFSTRAFIKATDKDAEPPNNIVRYEIISGNYNNKFILNSETGELTVRHSEGLGHLRKRRQTLSSGSNVYTLTVRAYDLGVLHRWSTAQVRVFPPDSGTRLLTFIMPAHGLDYEQMEELLIKMTGGQVTIVEIKPYHSHRYTRAIADNRKLAPIKEKSSVLARVTYGENSMIDVEHVYYLLQAIYYKGTPESDQIQYQKAESGMSLFWIILILLLLLIIICIALLLCYLMKCNPCYTFYRNEKKKNQVSDAAQTINLHNKGVQANNHHMESRNSTNSSHHNRWKFYRRRQHEAQPIFFIPKNVSPVRYRNTTMVTEEVPAFVYRTDLPNMERHGDLYIQDIADSEYHILDPSKLNVQRLNEQENISRMKNQNGKSSLERKRRTISPSNREETFVREGPAEILRLQTNEESTAEEILLHRPDKSYYNHFETNNTSKTSSSHTDITTRQMFSAKNATAASHIDYSLETQPSKELVFEVLDEPRRDKPKLKRSNHIVESEHFQSATEPATPLHQQSHRVSIEHDLASPEESHAESILERSEVKEWRLQHLSDVLKSKESHPEHLLNVITTKESPQETFSNVIATKESRPERLSDVITTKKLHPEPFSDVITTEEWHLNRFSDVITKKESHPERLSDEIKKKESHPEPFSDVIPTEEWHPERFSDVITRKESRPERFSDVITEKELHPERLSDEITKKELHPEPFSDVIPTEEWHPERFSDIITRKESRLEHLSDVITTEASHLEPFSEVIRTNEWHPERFSDEITIKEPGSEPFSEVIRTKEWHSGSLSDVITTKESQPEILSAVITTKESHPELLSGSIMSKELHPEPFSDVITTKEWRQDPFSEVITSKESRPEPFTDVITAKASHPDSFSELIKTKKWHSEPISDVITTRESQPEILLDVITTKESHPKLFPKTIMSNGSRSKLFSDAITTKESHSKPLSEVITTTGSYSEPVSEVITITKTTHQKLSNSVSQIGVVNYMEHSTANHHEDQSQQPEPSQATTSETSRAKIDISNLEEERNKLTSFQRDLLLTRFLVEEQRRYITQTLDTLSLPGSLSMGTQTDRHRATQTDLLCLLRPEPRKVKSENDDSSDSDVDCLYKTGKSYRRYTCIGRDKARYKIRTPILEESESIEGSRPHISSHRLNKTTLLRMAKNKCKIATREALKEAKSKLDLKYGKNKCKSSNLLDQKSNHVSLRDIKKSISYCNINDPRNVLSDKEMYTPRSLKSRLIARRLSASEPPKLGSHCLSHIYQDERDRQKALEKDPFAAEWCRTCELRKKKCVRCKNPSKQSGSNLKSSDRNKSPEKTENREFLPPITVTGTLKLSDKHQKMIEKKSIFAIAYDNAAIHRLGGSSDST